jgi:predicted DNA-binding transcriptional regulator YafY
MAQPRVMGDSRLARAAERALEKLLAALPVSLRAQAASIQERLHVDTTGWNGAAEDLSMLPIVQDAVSRDRRLAIRYWPAGREAAERVLDPLGLVAKGGTWYLGARSSGDLRTYRVSRIEAARLLDEAFERPAGFDLARHWVESTEKLRRGRQGFEATLRVSPDAAASFQRYRGSGSPPGPPDPEGWVTLVVAFDDEDQAAFVAQGLAARVDVLGPPSLRKRVAAAHAEAVGRASLSSGASATAGSARPSSGGGHG